MVKDLETKEVDLYLLAQARTSFIISLQKPSYRELEKSYNIPRSTLFYFAKKEDWENQRVEYHQKVIEKSQNSLKAKVSRERSKKLVKVNDIFHKGADKLIQQLNENQYRMTVKDLNVLARLAEFLAGEVEARKEHTFKLDKPLSEYTVEELLAMQRNIMDGNAEVIDIEDAEYEELVDSTTQDIEDED